MSTQLAIRASIDEIEAHRNRAIELFGQAYDAERDAFAAARAACPSTERMIYTDEDARRKHRVEHLEERRQMVDRAVWEHLIQATKMELLMDHTARDQFRAQLKANVPEATADNCYATLSQLMSDAGMIFKRGIATAFSGLDRRFRSHDGFKIGDRIVLSSAFSEHGGWNHYAGHDETLRDIERTFLTLDGKPHPERMEGIVGKIDEARYAIKGFSRGAYVVEDDYFRVRAFKNGNAHVWFKRDDLVERVNLLLADYYGAALGAGADVADVKHAPKTGLAKNYGFFETPDRVRERVYEEAGIDVLDRHGRGGRDPLTILEPSAGRGALARQAARAGHLVTCIEVQLAYTRALAEEGLYQHVAGADFLEVSPFVTGIFDRVIMNPPFDGGRDIDHVVHAFGFLRPGGILAAVMSAGVEFRQDRKTADFRAMVERFGGRFQDLPAGSFAESGTNVNTVIVTMRKPK